MSKAVDEQTVANEIQTQLTEKMMGLFGLVIGERQDHYGKNPSDVPSESDIKGVSSQ
jgi:hypothetical protein